MSKRTIFLLLVTLSLFLPIIFAQEMTDETVPSTGQASLPAQTDCLYYFYGNGCTQCPEVDNLLNHLQANYPQLNIVRYEVYYDRNNLNLLGQYYNAYSIVEGKQGLPTIFLADSYFVGKDSIINLLEQRIVDNTNDACPSLEKKAVIGLVGESSPKDVLETLTFGLVTGSSLKNAFNPGMMAVLVLLVVAFIHIKEKEKVFPKGVLYIGGVALSYLLFGLGFFSNLVSITRDNYFLKSIGFAAIIYAVIWLANFFDIFKALRKLARKEITKEKNSSKKIIFFSPPVMLLLGFITPLLTLAFVDSRFLVLRTLIAGGIGRLIVVPLLVYSVFITILPLLVIVFVIHVMRHHLDEKGQKAGYRNTIETEAWKKHFVKLLNFSLNLILLILGLLLVFR